MTNPCRSILSRENRYITICSDKPETAHTVILYFGLHTHTTFLTFPDNYEICFIDILQANEMTGVLGHHSAFVRLYWARDNTGY